MKNKAVLVVVFIAAVLLMLLMVVVVDMVIYVQSNVTCENKIHLICSHCPV